MLDFISRTYRKWKAPPKRVVPADSSAPQAPQAADLSTDEFLKSYLAEAQARVEKYPVSPESPYRLFDLLLDDPGAPPNRKRYMTEDDSVKMTKTDCLDLELAWIECMQNPPTENERSFGCHKFKSNFEKCRKQRMDEYDDKGGMVPLEYNEEEQL
ncbi:hypothetical protein GGF46_002662 [Coemansia sp. RSA 552]|nr:hypothetical protein GGF46_002662 [Coemansia sp. RSA 552]